MLLNILLLIFCVIPFGVSMSLYKNNKRFMATFYMATPVNYMCKYG